MREYSDRQDYPNGGRLANEGGWTVVAGDSTCPAGQDGCGGVALPVPEADVIVVAVAARDAPEGPRG